MDIKEDCEVYRILDRTYNNVIGSYSRAYHDEFNFRTVEEARNANVHGMFKDKKKYKINKYKVIFELIEDDVDNCEKEN